MTDNLESWWDDVLITAWMGTSRRPVPTSQTGAPPQEPEVELLEQLASGSARRAALAPLPALSATGHPESGTGQPEVPEHAARGLRLAWHRAPEEGERWWIVLEEWVKECERRGYRIPEIPFTASEATRILGRACTSPQQAPLCVALAGRAGRELAAAEPAWEPLFSDDPVYGAIQIADQSNFRSVDALTPEKLAWLVEEDTQLPEEPSMPKTSGLKVYFYCEHPDAERIKILRDISRHEPDEAAALLARVWDARPVNHSAHMAYFAEPIPPNDGTLLERALDDPEAKVRKAALELLDRRTDTPRAARMAERLRRLVSLGDDGRTIEVSAPGKPDAEGKRDGLGRAPRGLKAPQHHRAVIIRSAPLPAWGEITGLDPSAVVAGLAHDTDALEALAQAVANQDNAEWAPPLVAVGRTDPALVALLPREKADARVLALLRDGVEDNRVLLQLFRAVPAPWSRELSIAAVTAAMDREINQYYLLHNAEAFQSALHLDALPLVRKWEEKLVASSFQNIISTLVLMMTLRVAVRDCFE